MTTTKPLVKTQYGYANTKPQLQQRLKRIEGQIRGLSKMVDDDKYCIDVLTQVSAAKAALNKVALELLRDHSRHCLTNQVEDAHDGHDKADELILAISRII